LGHGEVNVGILKEAGEVVVHIRRHHEHARLLARILGPLDCHFFQFQDVDVVQLFQKLDLPQRRNGEAVLLIVHQDLLQCHQLPRSL
jgi:hypothetical protein